MLAGRRQVSQKERAMLSLSCADRWPEGLVELEQEVVTAAAQTEERDSRSTSSTSCTSNSICLDDSTSLQWLQEFSILDATVPQQPHQHHQHHHHAHLFGHQPLASDAPASPLAGDPASIGMPLTPGKPTAAAYSRLQSVPTIVAHGHCHDEVDYKTNPHIKPPYSYATLICMAMQASKKSKITLACIYKWITDNFCYYRHADPTWQVEDHTQTNARAHALSAVCQKSDHSRISFFFSFNLKQITKKKNAAAVGINKSKILQPSLSSTKPLNTRFTAFFVTYPLFISSLWGRGGGIRSLLTSPGI